MLVYPCRSGTFSDIIGSRLEALSGRFGRTRRHVIETGVKYGRFQKWIFQSFTTLGSAILLMAALHLSARAASQPRTVFSADADWKFFLGDPAGAESSGFNDGSWRTVTIPHDWSIEGTVDKKNPTGSGGGFYPAGIGWYRKTFTAPANWKGKRVSVEFDGCSEDATVYLNGQKLGNHPYGYTSFRFDLTPS